MFDDDDQQITCGGLKSAYTKWQFNSLLAIGISKQQQQQHAN